MKNIVTTGFLQDLFFKENENAHSHKYWEIICYTTGEGILKIGDKEIFFEPGTIVCQPPFIPHSEISSTGYKSIFFVVESFKEFDTPIPCFKDNDNKDVYNLMQIIHREFQKKSKNWLDITNSLLISIYQFFLAWNVNINKNPFIEQFENVLVQNILNKSFNLNEAMHEFPLSPNYFRNIFKKDTGYTPLNYLTHKKIDYAKFLLECKNSRLTLKEIADMIGFDNEYYFSRVFKKITGKCPKEYRKVFKGLD